MKTWEPTYPQNKRSKSLIVEGFAETYNEGGVKVPLTPQVEIGEVVGVVIKPVSVMKNLVDAGLHGVEAGIRALQD